MQPGLRRIENAMRHVNDEGRRELQGALESLREIQQALGGRTRLDVCLAHRSFLSIFALFSGSLRPARAASETPAPDSAEDRPSSVRARPFPPRRCWLSRHDPRRLRSPGCPGCPSLRRSYSRRRKCGPSPSTFPAMRISAPSSRARSTSPKRGCTGSTEQTRARAEAGVRRA